MAPFLLVYQPFRFLKYLSGRVFILVLYLPFSVLVFGQFGCFPGLYYILVLDYSASGVFRWLPSYLRIYRYILAYLCRYSLLFLDLAVGSLEWRIIRRYRPPHSFLDTINALFRSLERSFY